MISVVVPTTSYSESLGLCLDTLNLNKNVSEVILVNNTEKDLKSNSKYKDDFDKYGFSVRVVDINSKINSISKSWNIGILNKNRDNKIVLISNDDVVYSPGAVDNLLKNFNNKKTYIYSPFDFFDIVRDRNLYDDPSDETKHFLEKNKFFSYHTHIALAAVHGNSSDIDQDELVSISNSRKTNPKKIIKEVYGGVNNMNDIWNRLKKDVSIVDIENKPFGCCFMISDHTIQKVGMFDENFQIGYCEDLDYLKRVQIEGGDLEVCMSSYIHHLGSMTFRNISYLQESDFHKKNRAYLDMKYDQILDKDISFDIAKISAPIREDVLNLAMSDKFEFTIKDAFNFEKEGNIVCFNNMFGDPIFYFWISKKSDNEIMLRCGYFEENDWKNIDTIISKDQIKNDIKVKIQNGNKVFYDCCDGYLEVPVIHTCFVSQGDVRNKTPNSDVKIEI